MTIRIVLASLFLLLAAPASAQWGSSSELPTASDGSFAPDLVAADAEQARASATEQHRLGAGLIGGGLTLHIVGALGSFVGLIGLSSSGDPAPCARATTCTESTNRFDFGGLLVGSIATSAVGLVMFFVGLGLDIHSHVMRGHQAAQLALDANGLSLSF